MQVPESCVVPSNAPALLDPISPIPSRVLQERSANRCHDGTERIPLKRSCSPEEKFCTGQVASYFTGNFLAQLGCEKSDAQVELEWKAVKVVLAGHDKYKKYRERQKEAKDKQPKWPDFIEEPFWKACIRIPVVGRHQFRRDGELLGRNELVAEYIKRQTGISKSEMCRKVVSSHIQVLKNMLIDQPQILVYLTRGKDAKSIRRGRDRNLHLGHLRGRRHSFDSRGDPAQNGQNVFPGLPSSLALAKIQSGYEEALYTVVDFGMFVQVADKADCQSGKAPKQHVHDFTQLTSNSRLADLTVASTTSWHKQYPEFNFHPIDEFKHRRVIVCDASLKVMTMERPAEAKLNINFDLSSRADLGAYDSLECRTRFFEHGKPTDQIEGDDDGPQKRVRHTLTRAEYYPAHNGLLRVKFGARFWSHKMQKLGNVLRKAGEEEQATRSRWEAAVRKELQYMTAAQDVYGVSAGEHRCLLTILWRFHQTRSSHEPGRMSWRVVSFRGKRDEIKYEDMDDLKMTSAIEPTSSLLATTTMASPLVASCSAYPSLPLDFPPPFGTAPPAPPPLDFDALALDSMAADFSAPASASAPSLATDYSQPHSLPSVSDLHSLAATHPPPPGAFDAAHDFDFHAGHISIVGCLEPAISSISAYDTFHSVQPNVTHPPSSIHTHSHHALVGLDPDPALPSLSLMPPDPVVSLPGCYPIKPSWPHANLIPHLESAAEHFSELMGQGVLHEAPGGDALWKLQSGFGEDMGMGSYGGGKGVGVGERGRGEKFRGY